MNEQPPSRTPQEEENLEKKYEWERAWILKTVRENPSDFKYITLAELGPADFELVNRFLTGKLNDNEVRVRQNDLDLDNPLNSSQKELDAFLINQIMKRLTEIDL